VRGPGGTDRSADEQHHVKLLIQHVLDVLNAQREAVQARYSLADVDAQALSGALRVRIVSGALSADTLESLVLNPLPPLAPPSPLSDSTMDATSLGPPLGESMIPRTSR
jgi:hypothetical protein